MEFELNIPRGSRQQEFLDYLNAALRTRIASYTASARQEGGIFESSAAGPFSFGADSVPLAWRLMKDTDGALLRITVESTDPKIPEEKWKNAVHEFFNSVFSAAFSEKRERHFLRTFFYYIGPQLDGEYWLPRYRFAPAYPSDPEPHLINAERVVSIDQEVDAIDRMHAFVLADETARRNAARLSLLLNNGLYRSEAIQRWVFPVDGGNSVSQSVRYQLGFMNPAANLSKMPDKGAQCPLGLYKGVLARQFWIAGELLSLPPEARRVLRYVDNAPPRINHAFDRGARLFQVAAVCGQMFPSVGLAYRVAAVEAICQADGSYQSFSDFMRAHVKSRGNLDHVLDHLYRAVRSAHYHGGEFPSGEFNRQQFFEPLMDAEVAGRDTLLRTCHELTREAIVNWILDLISEHASEEN